LFVKSIFISEGDREHRSHLVILQKRTGISRAALERFVTKAARAVGLKGTVHVLIAGSTTMRRLNRLFRRKDQATDVLSFPAPEALPDRIKLPGRRKVAGDIAISADIAAQSAKRLGHSVTDETRILTLHGILHLAGFDHERDNGEMASREVALRRSLGLPAALTERVQPAIRNHNKVVRSRPAGKNA
jgi:probable rRNA maturation factor